MRQGLFCPRFLFVARQPSIQDLEDAAPRHRARAMVPAAIYSVTLAVAARRLQDDGCPCLTSATDSTSYPTFTLAGQTITYDNGELRVIPKPQTADVSPRCRSLYSGPRYRVMTLSSESAPPAAQTTVSPNAQPMTWASSRTAIVGSSRRRGALIRGVTWT